MEKWKTISGFSKYEVSSLGHVRNKITGYTLKGGLMTSGYIFVVLSSDEGGFKNKSIHRLVATTFLSKEVGKNVVHHKNDNKLKNTLDNLEWVTQKENLHKGCALSKMGDAHKKPIIMVSPNGDEKWFASATDCQTITGIKRSYINQVLKGRYKQTGGYKFYYEKRTFNV